MISSLGTNTSPQQARHGSNRNDIRGGSRDLQSSEQCTTITLDNNEELVEISMGIKTGAEPLMIAMIIIIVIIIKVYPKRNFIYLCNISF